MTIWLSWTRDPRLREEANRLLAEGPAGDLDDDPADCLPGETPAASGTPAGQAHNPRPVQATRNPFRLVLPPAHDHAPACRMAPAGPSPGHQRLAAARGHLPCQVHLFNWSERVRRLACAGQGVRVRSEGLTDGMRVA